MVAVALVLGSLLAQPPGLAFRERAGSGGWDLLRSGQRIEELSSGEIAIVRVDDYAGAAAKSAIVGVDLFGSEGSWQEPAVAARKLPATSTVKQLYVAFLKRRYGYQISAVNQAYGLDASAFTELESEDFSRVALGSMERDDLEFVADWIDDRLAAIRQSIRLPGRLLLVLVPTSLPARLLDAAAKVADGFLIRDHTVRPPTTRPVALLNKHCSTTVQPAWIAVCVRISNP